ncbi:putative Fe-S protein [Xenococcus sp. PCC 7305]|uniref:MOSC domain-containing protein n=1 Tax=Xenococcus sp. PCC 7305 TaxID=102125 RepID=UPI0002ACC63E|nr:MOSC N-terminal beta barrel domain-containing protein [Xenococcus sp. PCC 7305]ELS04753.1 putative Fe-S protein [Xenococcus sp. PCC 7305]
MIVSELYVYPIKSCQGIKLKQAEVTPKGFLWDREMMVISKRGKFLTQRQFPQLAKAQIKLEGDRISLSTADQVLPTLTFTPSLEGAKIAVEIWRDNTIAIDQGDEVAAWFHHLLELGQDKECRLVRQSATELRKVRHKLSFKTENPVSFADGYPFLLTATASLADLNRRIAETYQEAAPIIPMNHFRPNIVVETETPFEEDNWKIIKLGELKFALLKPCSRCIITTIDQKKGTKNELKEPLRTLGSFRQFGDRGVMFGENMVPYGEGILKVGDKLEIIEVR